MLLSYYIIGHVFPQLGSYKSEKSDIQIICSKQAFHVEYFQMFPVGVGF